MLSSAHTSGAAPTPILDLEQSHEDRRRDKLKDRLVLVACVLVVVLVGGVWIAALGFSLMYPPLVRILDYLNLIMNRMLPTGPGSIYAVLVIFPVLYLVVAVHESGHLLAGRLVKFRFKAVLVGPLSIALHEGQIKLRLHNQMETDGLALMEPEGLVRLRRRLLIFTSGGPAASLLTGALGLVLTWRGVLEYKNSIAANATALFIPYSLFIGLVNLCPFTFRGFTSDGRRLLTLLRLPTETRQLLSVIGLESQLKCNIAPRDWNGHWARSASSIKDRSKISLRGNWLAYTRANDRNEATEAAIYLERCLDLSSIAGAQFADILRLEAAVFMGWFGSDARKAQEWLRRVKKPGQIHPLLQVRASIAIDCASRSFDRALTHWEDGFKLVQQPPFQQQHVDAWLRWRKKIEERRQKYNVNATVASEGAM